MFDGTSALWCLWERTTVAGNLLGVLGTSAAVECAEAAVVAREEVTQITLQIHNLMRRGANLAVAAVQEVVAGRLCKLLSRNSNGSPKTYRCGRSCCLAIPTMKKTR